MRGSPVCATALFPGLGERTTQVAIRCDPVAIDPNAGNVYHRAEFHAMWRHDGWLGSPEMPLQGASDPPRSQHRGCGSQLDRNYGSRTDMATPSPLSSPRLFAQFCGPWRLAARLPSTPRMKHILISLNMLLTELREQKVTIVWVAPDHAGMVSPGSWPPPPDEPDPPDGHCW
jgi:hypothetical protein